MQYVEAFTKLGYRLQNQRTDWSAEKPDGVCITLWRKEQSIADRLPYVGLWELHPNGGNFEQKSGHTKRTRHLKKATQQFAGRVDVIFVSGTPGESYRDADPWLVEKRGSYWHISKFDPESGYFRAEIFRGSN